MHHLSDSCVSLIACIRVTVVSFLLSAVTSSGSFAEQPASLVVAVMGFTDTSDRDQAKGFNRALQEMLTTDIAVSRDVRVVERPQLEEVLKEQKLGKTEFLDPKSAARVGKGLGAGAVLTGSLWVNEGDMRIDARLVHVETGEVILPTKVAGRADSFLDLEKQIATSIVEALGARLSAFEKTSLSKRHTNNFKAAAALGQALEAEEAGDVQLARQQAALALEIDPDFSMAQSVVKEIERVLTAVRQEDALNRAGFLATFERRLFDWPLEDGEEGLGEYRKLVSDNAPHRALLWWMLDLEEKTFFDGTVTPYSMLFVDTDRINRDSSAGRAYLDAAAGDEMTFWCDVAQSNPTLAPKRRLTEEELHPDPLSLPARGFGRSYFLWRLPDIYRKRFYATVYCKGNMTEAARIATEYAEVCAGMGPEATLIPQLEELQKQLDDGDRRLRFYKSVRESRLRWQMMRESIIGFHVELQKEAFQAKGARVAPPPQADVRRELQEELATQPGPHLPDGNLAQRRRAAKQMTATLLKEASGADFIAFPFGDKAAREAGTMMVHLVGCPDSLTDPRIRMLYPWMEREPKPLASVEECLGERMIPCGRCRPLRWADQAELETHVASIGEALLKEAIATKGDDWPAGLADVLGQITSTPSPRLREPLADLCKLVADGDSRDREQQALVFRCLASVADEKDVAWLSDTLASTPYFDIRANAGAVLGAIGGPKAVESLSRAIDREPFYFVRHSLEASKRRARDP